MARVRNVGNLINEGRISRSRVLAAVDNLCPAQGAFKSAPDQWCTNEILEHLVLAEQSGITKMWLVADGARSGRPVWTGVHTNRGLSIDEVVEAGRLKKPRQPCALQCSAARWRIGKKPSLFANDCWRLCTSRWRGLTWKT